MTWLLGASLLLPVPLPLSLPLDIPPGSPTVDNGRFSMASIIPALLVVLGIVVLLAIWVSSRSSRRGRR